MRAVARAEPALVFALPVTDGNASEMGAYPDQYQEAGILRPAGVRRWIGKISGVILSGLLDFFWCSITHEHRGSAPQHGAAVAWFEAGQINVHRGQRLDIGRRIHLINKRPGRAACGYGAEGAGRNVEEVAAA